MYIKFIRIHISTSLIAIGLTILAFLITVFFIVIFRVEDKTISIINFYEQEIKANVKGAEYIIKPFDTVVFTINTNNSFDVSVMDMNNHQLENINVNSIGRNAQLVTLAVSDKNGYCFFKSRLKSNGGAVELDDKIILKDSPSHFAVTDMNISFEDYVYPGLSLEIESNNFSKPVVYIYPIACNQIAQDQNLLNTITAFSDYNAEDQLKYLQIARRKIEEAQSIETLDSSVSNDVNKYYIAEDKYLFIYE